MTDEEDEVTVTLNGGEVAAAAKTLLRALERGGVDIEDLNTRGRVKVGMGLLTLAALTLGDGEKKAFADMAAWCWELMDRTSGEEEEGSEPEEAKP